MTADKHDVVERLTLLTYELLDAHDDTVRIAVGTVSRLTWRAHLEYLRDLQRVGGEQLAAAVGRALEGLS